MLKIIKRNGFIKKIIVSFSIALIYILGRKIPLPNVLLTDILNERNSFLEIAMVSTGGSLSRMGLLTLGLGPSMSAMILAQLFSIGKNQNRYSAKVQDRQRKSLMLFISLIQAATIALSLQYNSSTPYLVAVLQATMILIAGAFVMYWLSNMNAAYGVGGTTLILLISILISQIENLPNLINVVTFNHRYIVGFLTFWLLLSIYLLVVLDKAEYRLPIKRVMIHNSLADETYIPFKLNTAGGMPLMYAFSLMSFPQYVLLLMGMIFPQFSELNFINGYFDIRTIQGVIIYLLIIILLSISFTFVNLDIANLTNGLRLSGDYFVGIRPGKPTEKYLTTLAWKLAIIGTTFLMTFVGVPMMFNFNFPELIPLTSINGLMMMITGMFLQIMEENRTRRLLKQYHSLFK